MDSCPIDCQYPGACQRPLQKCENYTPLKTFDQKGRRTNMVEKTDSIDHAIKHDAGKPIAGCLEEFSHALEAMVEVFDAGRREGYTRGSWENVEPERYKDAEWRHRLAGKREPLDQKSGLPHKFHEIWNALAQLELSERERLSGDDFNIDFHNEL